MLFLQDAINLSWKLRQALQLNLKDSDAALFDSYDRERGQAAKQVWPKRLLVYLL